MIAAGLLAGGLALPATAQDAARRQLEPVPPEALPVAAEDAAALIGLSRGEIVRLDDAAPLVDVLEVDLRLDGRRETLVLERHSIRAAGYRLLIDRGGGVIEEAEAGPVRTYRGHLRGEADSDVRASLLADGLHAVIRRNGRERRWLQPIGVALGEADPRTHILYADTDVLPHDGRCGGPDARAADDGLGKDLAGNGGGGGPAQGEGTLCTAQLACDADVQYFQDYGSVGAVENRINQVINTVNQQYESQTDITHDITTILVRTAEPDPYSSSDAQTLLCQFITEWSNNQQSIQRDVAQLFTGREVNGGTIGIAADIGATGICQNQGACTGGQFGTQGSYCLVQSDFNNNFSCATDLSAHELGHLWGAFHCSCPSFTMNPFITCANAFTGGSVSSIVAYRDSRTCLDCAGFPPANDACANAEIIAANGNAAFDTTDATPPAGQSDPSLPAGSPSCQWDGDPSETHSTVWYRFTAIDTSVQIETCAGIGVDDTILALYEGGCGALVELSCGEDDCGLRSSLCADGLVPGEQYTIMIGHPGGYAGSQPGPVQLQITSPCPDIGPVAGACCLPNGNCIDALLPPQCATAGGFFMGAGSGCSGIDCSEPEGACCLASGDCTVLDPFTCDIAGGVFAGAGVACGDIACGDPCLGDIDGSGAVGFDDLVSILAAWGPCPGCPQDLDGSGAVDFPDIVTVLAAWGPCP